MAGLYPCVVYESIFTPVAVMRAAGRTYSVLLMLTVVFVKGTRHHLIPLLQRPQSQCHSWLVHGQKHARVAANGHANSQGWMKPFIPVCDQDAM